MKLFARTGGHWLFWNCAIYFALVVLGTFWFKNISVPLVQLVWILTMSLPLYFPPFGRWLNLDIRWDRKMLDWFSKKDYPKASEAPQYSETKEQKKEPNEPTGRTMYSLGLTDNSRVSLKMGYSEITMNPQGVQNLIDQLELFKQQIMDHQPSEEENNG